MSALKSIIESPFKNEDQTRLAENLMYVFVASRKLMVEDKVAPLFFHSLYTLFLDDNVKEERDLGLFRSFEWHTDADEKLYVIDRGLSAGMILGAEDAIKKGINIRFATLCPEGHGVHRMVNELNDIEDPVERLHEAKYLIEKLQNHYAGLFDKNGDITPWRSYNEADYQKVVETIEKFFSPLIDHIRKVEKEPEQSRHNHTANDIGMSV